MLKVVIDTNVLVSAALKDGTPEQAILFVLQNDNYQWIVSAEILAEYSGVLCRKKLNLSEATQQRWQDLLKRLTTCIEVSQKVDFPRDQKDARFIDCSIAADADFLITGDKDFEEAQKLTKAQIISVSAFIDQVSNAS